MTTTERNEWPYCTVCWIRGGDGRMRSWRGTDGHNGVEWFSTCDRCGVTY